MAGDLIERISVGRDGDADVPLRIRIFRLICVTTAVLCIGLVLPMNLLQGMAAWINVATVVLGLNALYCFWASRRGRHLLRTFLWTTTLLIDFIWFVNAGSQGSVTYVYFPLLLFSLAMFPGRPGWLAALGLTVNMGALFLLEHFYPELITPFRSPMDRLLDHLTGIVTACSALAAVTWLILSSHERERQKVAAVSTRLASSEQNYREIFDATSDAMFVHDPSGRWLDLNRQACALFGFDRETGMALSFNDCSLGVSPYSEVEARRLVAAAFESGPQVFEWHCRRQNGELFWTEVALRACRIAGEDRVIASVRDISRRKKTEEVMRQNEERLRLALAASAQGWFEMNVQTGEGHSSEEYVRMIGEDPATFTTTLQNWSAGIHPDDRDPVLQAYRECIATGETRTMEYRRRVANGSWKWIRSVGRIVERDAAGQPLRMHGTHADITDRKDLEAQLLHSQRLEAVGTLASGVAHDLNNILTPMLMASGLLREKLADQQDRDLMTMLDNGGKRGAAIVKQLLAFSRNLAQERQLLDPRTLLAETVQLMRSVLSREIELEVHEGDNLGQIRVEPTQLHQVLMNLCVNARDAMPGGGKLSLSLERVKLPPPGQSIEGDFVVFAVQDTGEGIPPENLDRIFDPFFTTKETGKGTGLGLPSAHGIVKSHGGMIRVESTPGKGSTFRVYLPAVA